MSREYRVTVPIKPQAATRPRTTIKNGQARTYNVPKYSQWLRDFGRLIVGRFSEDNPRFREPVAVEVYVHADKLDVYVTEIGPGRRGTVRGDIDNIAKAVLDGLTHRGVLADDRQVHDLRVAFKA